MQRECHLLTITHAERLQCFLQNKNSEFSAPLTSFDWNETDLNRLGTSSIDTTCTIWDIEVCSVLTQLRAGLHMRVRAHAAVFEPE